MDPEKIYYQSLILLSVTTNSTNQEALINFINNDINELINKIELEESKII
jgi:hypothetical protein